MLIAADSNAAKKFEELLARHHELVFASTVGQSIDNLRQQAYDAILCDLLFDESKMIDLLQLVKSEPELSSIRFICCRTASTQILSMESIAKLCLGLGAAAFVDLVGQSASTQKNKLDAAIRDGQP